VKRAEEAARKEAEASLDRLAKQARQGEMACAMWKATVKRSVPISAAKATVRAFCAAAAARAASAAAFACVKQSDVGVAKDKGIDHADDRTAKIRKLEEEVRTLRKQLERWKTSVNAKHIGDYFEDDVRLAQQQIISVAADIKQHQSLWQQKLPSGQCSRIPQRSREQYSLVGALDTQIELNR
jgi:hypothetical protein